MINVTKMGKKFTSHGMTKTHVSYWISSLTVSLVAILLLPIGLRSSAAQEGCPGNAEPRLVIGEQGQVIDDKPNNVRTEPDPDTQKLGEIPSGAQFTVVDGPACGGGFTYWQVNYQGLVGWTAESDPENGEYWLAPIAPVGSPTEESTSAIRPPFNDGVWRVVYFSRIGNTTSTRDDWKINLLEVDTGELTQIGGWSWAWSDWNIWSPSGLRLVHFSDKSLRLFDTTNAALTARDNVFSGVFSVAWLPNDEGVVYLEDGTPYIYPFTETSRSLPSFSVTPALAPQFSPDGSRLAFPSKEESGDYSLYIVNADGSNLLLAAPLGDSGASSVWWSPNSTKLAFITADLGQTGFLSVVNADASGLVYVSADLGGFDPVWSPDSTRLVFKSIATYEPSPRNDYFVVNADGGGLLNITNTPDRSEYGAVWSPDGTRLAFAANETSQVAELFVINADGSNLRQLTDDTLFKNYLVTVP